MTIGIMRYKKLSKRQRRLIVVYACLILLVLSLIGIDALQYSRQGVLHYKINGFPELHAQVFQQAKEETGQQGVAKLHDEIYSFIAAWKAAWENTTKGKAGIERYISFYSANFDSKGLGQNGWKRDKAEKGRYKSWINVDLIDIRIDEPGADNFIEVRFLQDYRSSNYSEKSKKMLVIKKEKTGWKITTEKAY